MSKYRIVFLDTDTLGNVLNLNCFSDLGEYKTYSQTRPEEVVTRIADQEIVITNKVVIS